MKRRGFFGLLLAPLVAPFVRKPKWVKLAVGPLPPGTTFLAGHVGPTEFRGSFKLTELLEMQAKTSRDMTKYLEGVYLDGP